MIYCLYVKILLYFVEFLVRSVSVFAVQCTAGNAKYSTTRQKILQNEISTTKTKQITLKVAKSSSLAEPHNRPAQTDILQSVYKCTHLSP
jgi:hypothetical protein